MDATKCHTLLSCHAGWSSDLNTSHDSCHVKFGKTWELVRSSRVCYIRGRKARRAVSSACQLQPIRIVSVTVHPIPSAIIIPASPDPPTVLASLVVEVELANPAVVVVVRNPKELGPAAEAESVVMEVEVARVFGKGAIVDESVAEPV